MRKKIMKSCNLIILLVMMICFFNNIIINYSFASDIDISQFDSPSGSTSTKVSNAAENISETIIGVVRTVCLAIAIVILLVIIMKYMLASPSDRADIKKHAIAYVIGAAILFGTSGILSIIIKFSESIK